MVLNVDMIVMAVILVTVIGIIGLVLTAIAVGITIGKNKNNRH